MPLFMVHRIIFSCTQTGSDFWIRARWADHSGERCVRIAEVEGSIPFKSTNSGIATQD